MTLELGDQPITCIVSDAVMAWSREVANKLGIRVAVVWPASAASYSLAANIPNLIRDGYIDDDGFSIKKQRIQLSSSIPSFGTENLPWKVGDSNAEKAIFKYTIRNFEHLQSTEWQMCNSFYELEAGALSLFPKLLPIGPLLASNDTGNLGAQFWQEDYSCLTWLDQQPSRSVIYAAFGSFTIFDQIQFQELARGLQLTNKPFLWVVRPGSNQESNHAYPKEFHGSHGKIVGWVPQQNVLSHPSIACFFHNANYICDTWKVGLGFDKDENGIIRKEEFNKKVELLLGDKSIREKALELKQIARNNIGDGSQDSTNFSNFIKWLEEA
ncbi:hypothetical protein GH714_012628 [Hevea brasiliensis]|uniref:EF-hand domain-containing protein n=1 Tax=Hevea brasiliensis TaxID=3981 RepID=A0A6A6MNY3_HEVBR|nr:hypothetical protein GH714_012628 [Hevea brasiliensis]